MKEQQLNWAMHLGFDLTTNLTDDQKSAVMQAWYQDFKNNLTTQNLQTAYQQWHQLADDIKNQIATGQGHALVTVPKAITTTSQRIYHDFVSEPWSYEEYIDPDNHIVKTDMADLFIGVGEYSTTEADETPMTNNEYLPRIEHVLSHWDQHCFDYLFEIDD